MSLITKIRLYFFDYFLKQKISSQKIERNPVDFDSAKSIGIVFDATEETYRKQVSEYANQLSKNGRSIKLFGFYNGKQKELSFPFKHFTKNNVSWSLIPQGEKVESFLKNNFDVLISLYLPSKQSGIGRNPAIEFISTFSKANLRVGPFSKNTNCYDLIIDTPIGTDLQYLIKQIDFFLNRINRPAYESATV